MKKMCKRSLALLMTMVMVCGAIMVGGDGLLSFKASAIGTYGVNLDSAAYNGWNPFAVSGYSGQCTWYAWGRAREKLGIDVPCRGDAVDWPNQAGSYLVNSTPSSNAICVWTHYNPGHVAYVESYDAGLNRIYITEANANNTRYSEGYIDLNTGNYTGTYGWVSTWRGRGNPHQYIHLQPTDTTPPTVSNVQVTNRTVDGYTVTCTVSDNVGVARVAFPTWTIANGQDDLIWHNGNISGSTASFRVLRSAHNNETETFITDIYAYDAAGNMSEGVRVGVNMNYYKVSFVANGGSGAPSSQTKLHDVNLTLSTTKPTRSGYTFKNWNTKSDGTGTSYSAGGTYKANAAATLYAQWTKNASLASIAVKTLPTKTVYDVGESFRSAGLTLTATYSDGSTQSVTSGFACTGFTSDMAGTKTVTVTYGGQSTTFAVTVVGTTVTIADFRSERTEHYKTSVRFYAATEKAPANTTVHWFVNGADVGTGNEYTVRQPKEDYTVQAKLLDSNGQTVAESETETVHVRHDLWSRLRALIQWLFGVDYVVDQRENDLLASVQDA
ncbi:MAG: InlB B-repeat-containing protein [Clostridia bacterium]|nr:InlB B-repeat-containing protein [Clostridia bacterium]